MSVSSHLARSSAGRALAVLLGVAAALGGAARAEAQRPPPGDVSDGAKAQAKALAEEANGAFEDEKFAEALSLYTQAEALFHAPTHVLMIARTEVALGRLARAHASYGRVTDEVLGDDAPAAFKKAREEARAEAAELEARVPKVRLTIANASDAASLVVKVDGAALPPGAEAQVVRLDPGAHTFEASVDDRAATPMTVTLREGETRSVTLELPEMGAQPFGGGGGGGPTDPPPDEPAPAPASVDPVKIAGFVGLGVGSAVAIYGLVKTSGAIGAASDADALYAACGGKLCPASSPQAAEVRALDEEAASQRRTAVASFVVSGALLGAGVGLLVWSNRRGEAPDEARPSESRRPRRHRGPRVRALATWNGAFVTGTF